MFIYILEVRFGKHILKEYVEKNTQHSFNYLIEAKKTQTDMILQSF